MPIDKGFTHRTACAICGSQDLSLVLDLGTMALANAFIKKEDLEKPEGKFPLAVYFCGSCSLLQLLDIVDPEILFRDYDYLTSASKPLAEHLEKMGKDLVNRFAESPNDLVMEIGGNDGVLLGAIKDKVKVLNVDPATNVAELSKKKGIETVNEFFTKKIAETLVQKYGTAKVAVANNVMAHIADIKDVFDGVRTMIGEKGIFVMEAHWVGNLIGTGGFDQIYHEHLYYYSLHALRTLVRQFGLDVFDIEMVSMHGESMRVFIAKNRLPSERVAAFLKNEEELGLLSRDAFLKFSEKVARNKKDLNELLARLKSDGKKMVGYGAPAKGNTLLNYCGIGPELLDYITDTTPLKQGRYAPGSHIIIRSPEALRVEKPDYVLLLAWNYAEAILFQERVLRNEGVKFIIPVPLVKVV